MSTEFDGLKGDVLELFTKVHALGKTEGEAGLTETITGLTSENTALTGQVTALTAENTALKAQLAALTPVKPLSVGARVQDISWSQAVQEIGDPRVTRWFYHSLPKTFAWPKGVPHLPMTLIVSFKDPVTNVTSYAASCPDNVQLVFNHEPEKDYATGAEFVTKFNTAMANARKGKLSLQFGFIAGGYQYGASTRMGWKGTFIPPTADLYYMDSYQRGPSFVPAAEDKSVQRYLSLLKNLGVNFNGFTEYGRGVIPFGGKLDPRVPAARAALFETDLAYLRSLPDVRVWSYWYTLDGADPKNETPDQWRLTDAASQKAWRSIMEETK